MIATNHVNGYSKTEFRAFPNESNPEGTLFGGEILSQVDKIGSLISRRFTKGGKTMLRTILSGITKPVTIGNVLILEGEVIATGGSSFLVYVKIQTESLRTSKIKKVGYALLVETTVGHTGEKIIKDFNYQKIRSTLVENDEINRIKEIIDAVNPTNSYSLIE